VILQPQGRRRERILAYGGEGSGKTSAAVEIALRCLLPGQTMRVLDADNTWDTFAESRDLKVREEWRGGVKDDTYTDAGGQLEIWHTTGWEEHARGLEMIWARTGPGDWVVVDDLTHLWDDIQAWYVETVHGRDFPQFLIDARVQQLKDNKGGDAGVSEMLVEWSYINKVWNDTFAKPYVNTHTHCFVMAGQKKLRTDDRGRDREAVTMYGKLGVVPATQKNVGKNSHTVVHFEHTPIDTFIMSTVVKDRERERVERVEVGRFPMTYLMKIAGWKPSRGG
jgi:hypothetical protein